MRRPIRQAKARKLNEIGRMNPYWAARRTTLDNDRIWRNGQLNSQASVGRAPLASSLPLVIFFTFTACWIFDLRATPSEGWLLPIQQGLFGLAMLAVLLSMALGGVKPRVNRFLLSYVVIFLFMAASAFSGIALWQNDLGRLVANEGTLMVLLAAIYLIEYMKSRNWGLYDILDYVVGAAIIATIGRVVLIIALRGVNPSTIRYQILCGAMSVSLAYGLTRFLGKPGPRALAFIVFQAAVAILAVTKTVLVEVGLAAGLLVLFVRRRSRQNGGSARIAKSMRFVAMIMAGSMVLSVLLVALPGNPIERWSDRLGQLLTSSNPYADVSGLARRALVAYQFEQLSNSKTAQFFGFGMGAKEGFGGFYWAYLSTHGISDIQYTGFGDNVYTSLLYLGGYVFGGAMIIMMLFWGIWALRLIRWLGRHGGDRYYDLLIPPLAVVGVLLESALGGTFGNRMTCMFFGYAIGLMLWIDEATRMRGRAIP